MLFSDSYVFRLEVASIKQRSGNQSTRRNYSGIKDITLLVGCCSAAWRLLRLIGTRYESRR